MPPRKPDTTAIYARSDVYRGMLGELPLQNTSYLAYFEVVTSPALARLGDIASEQWGLITRREISAVGVSARTMDRLAAPGSALERVATGVYRLAGAPIPDHMELRAAWLQLAPDVPAWERRPDQGLVSHRSAAALYGVGHLVADVHEFKLPHRRQTRRTDVRLHVGPVTGLWIRRLGLLLTRPSRIAADLLTDHEDPEAVAQIIVESIRSAFDYPGTFAETLGPHASRFGFRRGDGLSLLRWLLSLVDTPDADEWIDEAAKSMAVQFDTASVASSL